MKKRWTEDRVALLRRLAGDGVAAKEIALRLGEKLYAVKAQLSRHAIRTLRADNCRLYTRRDIALMRAMAARGLEAKAIAAELGRTVNSIWSTARKQGIRLSKVIKWTAGEEFYLREQAAAMTVAQLKAALGRGEGPIRLKLAEMQLRARPARAPKQQRYAAAAKPGPESDSKPQTAAGRPERKPMRRVELEVSRIAYCPECGAPVVNTWESWRGHRQRLHAGQEKRRA